MDCGKFYLCFLVTFMTVHTYTGKMGNFFVKENCLCPGSTVHNLTYECTTVGRGTTLWRGTAFKCSAVGNEISLRHNRFTTPDGAYDQCNNGNITGRSLRVEGEHYTSQIHVIFTPDLLGRTIECVHNNLSSYQLIGNSTIAIITDPLPPPDDITLSVIHLASIPELRFNWTKNTIKSCHVAYTITSDCGHCPTSTPINTAVCINVPVNNRTCSFAVRTVVCGSIDGTHSNSISVTLKVPNAPSIDAVPLYSHKTGHLVGIKTIFMELAPFTITDGIDGGATSYTITYTEASSGNVCGSETIPSSSCSGGICTHLFDLYSSNCGSAPISAEAVATNVFGPGPVSSPITIFDTINNFFNVTFDLSSDVAICTFLKNQHESTTKTCTFIYNQSESCQLDTPESDTSYTAQSASNIVRVSFLSINNLHDGTEQHCFVVSASNGTYKAIIQGTLNTGCDPNRLYAGAVASSAVAVCDPPLSYIGTLDGYACYSGTLVGAYAVHRCLNCDYRSVRVCMADGNWNGTTPQCKCSQKEPLLNQLSLSIIIPIIIILLCLVSVIVITIITKKSLQRVQTQVMDPPDSELSAIYEEIESNPQQIMEENVAYNTVQEFQEGVKSETIPDCSQLESKPEQIMEENMAYNTKIEFQEKEKSPDSQLESNSQQIMEENVAYNTAQEFQEGVKSEAIPDSQLESKPEQIMEENIAYNTVKSESQYL